MPPKRSHLFPLCIILVVLAASAEDDAGDDDDDVVCDLSAVCEPRFGGFPGNFAGHPEEEEEGDHDCVSAREAVCGGRCLSADFPILVERGSFYSDEQLQNLVGGLDRRLPKKGVCVSEHECESLSPAITYSRLRVSSKIAPSWVCQSRCLPLHIGCDGVCNINLFLEQRKQRRAKQLRLFGGRKDVIKARREEESRPRPAVCKLDEFYKLSSPRNVLGEICLSPGMACNGTCALWATKDDTGRDLRLFDDFFGETICVPFCHRESEWQCRDRCQLKEEPCLGRCPAQWWLCKKENKCIPLRWVCDGSTHLGCADGSDEADCGGCADGMRTCGSEVLCQTAKLHLPCDGECGRGYEKCDNDRCVTHREACNGTCLRPDMLQCGSQCYNVAERCNGVQDCADGADEADCAAGGCANGSRRCGQRIICKEDFCAEDTKVAAAAAGGVKPSEASLSITEESCAEKCDHFWCKSEKRCINRNDQLQGCSDLSVFPYVDGAIFTNVSGVLCDAGVWGGGADGAQVYRQASCMPDPQGGNCPTSLRAGPGEVKLWLRCGNACWKKNVYFQKEEELPFRYRSSDGERCHHESFDDLCLGVCKFYDAWFCGEKIQCTDQPCGGRCPSAAGPNQEPFYLCSGRCIPESVPCQNKCLQGRFRCGNRCLSPRKVCDGHADCFGREDEDPSFCGGCAVGQRICSGGVPTCLDQKCPGDSKCFEDFVDCGFEGSSRNICADRLSSCIRWMERRYGKRIL